MTKNGWQGLSPIVFKGWNRDLHADYPATKPYKALFYAALLLSEQKGNRCACYGFAGEPVHES